MGNQHSSLISAVSRGTTDSYFWLLLWYPLFFVRLHVTNPVPTQRHCWHKAICIGTFTEGLKVRVGYNTVQPVNNFWANVKQPPLYHPCHSHCWEVLRAHSSGGPWPFTGSSVPLFSAHLLLADYKLLIPTTLLTQSTSVYLVCPPKIIDGVSNLVIFSSLLHPWRSV